MIEHQTVSAVPPRQAPQWQRVSMRHVWADLVGNLLPAAVASAAAGVLLYLADEGDDHRLVWVLFAAAVLFVINALFAFRRVRAIGYILREDDMLFRRGIMFERVIAVPYGRLQMVDVTRGPLQRVLGIATLKFVTASAATGVQLPGLRVDEAEKLRDQLVALAETRRSGL